MTSVKGKAKSERHHWWPECVSQHWQDESGGLHWLLPDGAVRSSTPRNFGVVTNGHFIKLGQTPGEETVWDQNFEPIFARADDSFPKVIEWLQSLDRRPGPDDRLHEGRFYGQQATDDKLRLLVECLLSLAIRSPMNREAAVGLAERFRGPLAERERNTLIALNMRDSLNRALEAVGTRGKFVVLYSPDREFVFGDGFYSNLRSPVQHSYRARMLVPITPDISVLHVQPSQYSVEPRLMTMVLNSEEADAANEVVQVYARQALFFRSQKPNISENYKCFAHKQFSDHNNPVDRIIHSIPGVRQQRGWPIL